MIEAGHGFIYFWIIYSKYRNTGARHNYETETKTNMTNLREDDSFVKRRTRLDSSTMDGANNTKITGNSSKFGFDNVKNILK